MPTTRRTLRLIELAVLFGVLPWWYAGWPVRAWGIWPPIVLGFAGCLAYLLLDKSFERRVLWNRAGARHGLRGVLLRFTAGALVLTAGTYFFERRLFFSMPRERPGLWLAVLVLYPVWSVYPQEIIFRTFFVQRYGPVLRRLGGDAAVVATGAAAFGWAHVIFGTTLAVVLSGIGGVLFMTTFLRTRSTAAAALEHALYGDLLFTAGLGWYFYSGSIGAAGPG